MARKKGKARPRTFVLDYSVQETLQLARAQNLSVYDATYLELAMRQALPLATLDENLKAAAAAVGVAEYKP